MDKDFILKRIPKVEDKLLVAKILDKYALAEKIKKSTTSEFLDPYQRSILEKSFELCGIKDYFFFGGYSGAERTVVVFCPYNMPDNIEQEFSGLFEVLHIKPKSRANLSHRDYLGSLMGLGIKREKIGDILVRDDYCFVVILKDIAEYIKYNLAKVGNVNVEVQTVDAGELGMSQPKVKEISSTVASLRLDSVASVGFGMSRSKIADFIRAEKVYVNWEITNNVSKPVKEGDTISIRGKGRVVLEKVGNTTKKDRIHILMKKFI